MSVHDGVLRDAGDLQNVGAFSQSPGVALRAAGPATCALALAFVFDITAGAAAVAQDLEWTGGESSSWIDEGNWSPGGIPGINPSGPGVVATVPEGFDAITVSTVLLDLESVMAQSPLLWRSNAILRGKSSLLNVNFSNVSSAPTITCHGTLTMTGECAWKAAHFEGDGQFIFDGEELTIGPLNGTNLRGVHDTYLEINGPVTQDFDLGLTGELGSILNNDTWTMTAGNASKISAPPQNPGTFQNEGTLKVLGPFHVMSANLVNNGTLDIAGQLQVNLPAIIGGEIEMSEGGYLNFWRSIETVGGVAATGEGTVRLGNEGGAHVIPAGSTFTSNLSDGGEESVAGLLLDLCDIQVDGQFVNQGKMRWFGPDVAGQSDGDGAVFNVDGGFLDLDGAELSTPFRNTGTVNQTKGLLLQGGTVENFNASATWVFDEFASITGTSGTFFNIGGTLLKPNKPSSMLHSQVSRTLIFDGGNILVQGPEPTQFGQYSLGLNGGGELRSGVVHVEDAGKLVIFGGPWVFGEGGITFSGDRFIELLDGPTDVNVPAGATVTTAMDFGGAFTITGGTIHGSGTWMNSGFLQWTGGEINLENIAMEPSIVGGLVNSGSMLHQGSSVLSGLLANENSFTIQGELDTASSALLLNADTLVLSAGAATIGNSQNPGQGALHNSGEIIVQSGGSAIHCTLNNAATVTVLADAALSINGAALAQLEDGCLNGGTWSIGGTLNINKPISCISPGANVSLFGEGTFPALTQSLTTCDGSLSVAGQPVTAPLLSEIGGSCSVEDGGSLETEKEVQTSIATEMKQMLAINLGGGFEPGYIVPVLHNSGTIIPGGENAAGPFSLLGDIINSESAVLEIELGGTAPVTDHDQLIVDGNLALGGTLSVHVLQPYLPSVGQQFTIATASGEITGTFDQIIGDGRFAAIYHANSVMLTYEGPAKPGDLNGDGSVGVPDLLLLLGLWGQCVDVRDCPADLDGDGSVGVPDLLLLLANWG